DAASPRRRAVARAGSHRLGVAHRPGRPRVGGAEHGGARGAALAQDEGRRVSGPTEVQVDWPDYRSTEWRAPRQPLVTLPEELHRLDGPVFGEDVLAPSDNDLTPPHEGGPV